MSKPTKIKEIELILDSLYYVEESYAKGHGDDLAYMINILKEKVNEIIMIMNDMLGAQLNDK